MASPQVRASVTRGAILKSALYLLIASEGKPLARQAGFWTLRQGFGEQQQESENSTLEDINTIGLQKKFISLLKEESVQTLLCASLKTDEKAKSDFYAGVAGSSGQRP